MIAAWITTVPVSSARLFIYIFDKKKRATRAFCCVLRFAGGVGFAFSPFLLHTIVLLHLYFACYSAICHLGYALCAKIAFSLFVFSISSQVHASCFYICVNGREPAAVHSRQNKNHTATHTAHSGAASQSNQWQSSSSSASVVRRPSSLPLLLLLTPSKKRGRQIERSAHRCCYVVAFINFPLFLSPSSLFLYLRLASVV